MKQIRKTIRRTIITAFTGVVLGLFAGMGTATATPALTPPTPVPCSPSGCGNGCVNANHNALRALINTQHNLTRMHMTQEMRLHQRWWFTDFFDDHILPAQMMMAQQLTTVGMQQMEIVGALLDAKHQLESQRLFQTKIAEAHKDYQSSHGMCTFATMARSLSAGDTRAEATSFILTQRALRRQLSEQNTMAADGRVQDQESRLSQFIGRYCDIFDANATLNEICDTSSPSTTINKDIDYNRLIETPVTLTVDFTDGDTAATGDEGDVMALTANLFGNTAWHIPSEANLGIYNNAQDYYDMRALVAKRSVAQYSFNSIIGLKAQGSEEAEETAGYAARVLSQLGVPDPEVFTMLGNRPSYFAMMDVMSQKLYQRPEFYTDLYDKPANIARKDASMRAIGLMLDRDMYKSDMRYEMLLAVLLEMELMKHQRPLYNRIIDMTEGAKESE